MKTEEEAAGGDREKAATAAGGISTKGSARHLGDDGGRYCPCLPQPELETPVRRQAGTALLGGEKKNPAGGR